MFLFSLVRLASANYITKFDLEKKISICNCFLTAIYVCSYTRHYHLDLLAGKGIVKYCKHLKSIEKDGGQFNSLIYYIRMC